MFHPPVSLAGREISHYARVSPLPNRISCLAMNKAAIHFNQPAT